ncbi:Methyltransferase domain-containing protein [Tistlia consotensis]|uniref:Methyltransferase domain-containing protein n=1 Tax=Tistlia consotensis USBA 355 TaxID=560819 RepID=A0A1Y6B9Y0_9PROT|nr:methyltransferase domain-containing protein [Tistlia consotensis]SME98721.1 Methyltransferase domain-containing protein [Tistlia consotensis USBA 355]SNR58125.1 Methyltransferase domain-containing protein [Tistlia consotensis]
MRRVILEQSDDSQDNLFFHLARYKFISRLVKPSDRLIEIGCGSGYGSRYLSDYVGEVVAVDEEVEMIDYARGRFVKPNLAYDTGIGERSGFDVVVCLEVIEHMSKDKGRQLLATIRSLMNPGGVAFISTPRKIPNPSENRKKYHVHEYEYEEYREILEETFSRALVLTQVDEIISTHNPACAWNFVAICYQ